MKKKTAKKKAKTKAKPHKKARPKTTAKKRPIKKLARKAKRVQKEKSKSFGPTLFEETIVQCANCGKSMRLIKVPEFDTSGMLCQSCSKGEIELSSG